MPLKDPSREKYATKVTLGRMRQSPLSGNGCPLDKLNKFRFGWRRKTDIYCVKGNGRAE